MDLDYLRDNLKKFKMFFDIKRIPYLFPQQYFSDFIYYSKMYPDIPIFDLHTNNNGRHLDQAIIIPYQEPFYPQATPENQLRDLTKLCYSNDWYISRTNQYQLKDRLEYD